MGYLCDFCGEQRSIVYCRSDAASLCLSCDRNVHSANALSKRHSRTLACEKCNTQPAVVRRVEQKISLCQNCDWIENSDSDIRHTHKTRPISCYSGCPSAAELSAIWSHLFDFSSLEDSICERGPGSTSIIDNRSGDIQGPLQKNDFQDTSVATEGNDLSKDAADKSTLLMREPLLLDSKAIQPPASYDYVSSKDFSMGASGPGLSSNDVFYNDFNMDEVDLSIENYEEFFGVDNPEQLFDNDGIDKLFGVKHMSGSNCQGAYTAEGSSVGGVSIMQPACSTAASVDSVLSTKTEPNLCLTGDSCAKDFNYCGASSMRRMGEPRWCPPCPEISLPSSSRSDAVLRYKEKKKTRKFEKKVRYASRKARADVRRREKGRFVKAGGVYDYDPLVPSRSY